MKRIDYLSGVKGISAFIVFFAHFCSAFASYLPPKMCNLLYKTPLYLFVAGHYMVSLFCTLSAFFVALKVINTTNKKKLLLLFPKRYFRIVLPLVPLAIIIYMLSCFNLFYNIELASLSGNDWLTMSYQDKLSITEILISVFYKTPLLGDLTINGNLWMIKYIVLGAIVSILISVTYIINPYISYTLSIIAFFLCDKKDPLYTCSVIGSILAILYMRTMNIRTHKLVNLSSMVLVLTGLFLGGYNELIDNFALYNYLRNILSYWHILILGSTIFTIGIMYSPLFQKFFQLKLFSNLGDISFSLYLVHFPIMCSLSAFCFLKLYYLGIRNNLNLLITFTLTLIVTIISTHLFNKYVEKNCSKLINILFHY